MFQRLVLVMVSLVKNCNVLGCYKCFYFMIVLVFNRFMDYGYLYVYNQNVIQYLFVFLGISNCRKKNNNLIKKQKIIKDVWKRLEI